LEITTPARGQEMGTRTGNFPVLLVPPLRESAKGVLALGGYETQILAMRFPTGILYYR
jgi:hypothetical protein